MKEKYTDKTDNLITELKKGSEYMFVGYIADCIKEFMPISKSEIRTAFIYAGLKVPKADIKFIYVRPDLISKIRQFFRAKVSLSGIKLIMHQPEQSLFSGATGS